MTSSSLHSGCFICRPEDPAFADVEGCPACEADFGQYVRDLIDAGLIDDIEEADHGR